jgi:hypothetical protein
VLPPDIENNRDGGSRAGVGGHELTAFRSRLPPGDRKVSDGSKPRKISADGLRAQAVRPGVSQNFR